MLRDNCRLALTGILLLVLPVIGLSEDEPYYMWTDDNGILNFSEIEPVDAVAETIVKPMPFGDPVVEESDESEPPPVVTQNQVPSEITELEQANARTREKSCASARRTLEKLQKFKTIIVRGDDGFWREISGEARLLEVSDAEEAITENCLAES